MFKYNKIFFASVLAVQVLFATDSSTRYGEKDNSFWDEYVLSTTISTNVKNFGASIFTGNYMEIDTVNLYNIGATVDFSEKLSGLSLSYEQDFTTFGSDLTYSDISIQPFSKFDFNSLVIGRKSLKYTTTWSTGGYASVWDEENSTVDVKIIDNGLLGQDTLTSSSTGNVKYNIETLYAAYYFGDVKKPSPYYIRYEYVKHTGPRSYEKDDAVDSQNYNFGNMVNTLIVDAKIEKNVISFGKHIRYHDIEEGFSNHKFQIGAGKGSVDNIYEEYFDQTQLTQDDKEFYEFNLGYGVAYNFIGKEYNLMIAADFETLLDGHDSTSKVEIQMLLNF